MFNKNLIFLVSSRTIVTFGTQMMAVVAAWQMYELSHSPFWLGLVGLAQYIPMLALFMVTGKVADHYDRRLIIMVSESIFAISALTMAITSMMHILTKEIMLCLIFINGLAYAFQGPASQALLPNIVKKKVFPRATALITSTFQISTIIGPAIGGFLVHFDYYIPYFLITLCGFMSVFFVSNIKLKNKI
jgi:MFS family permease